MYDKGVADGKCLGLSELLIELLESGDINDALGIRIDAMIYRVKGEQYEADAKADAKDKL